MKNPNVKYQGEIWESPIRTQTKHKANEHADRFRKRGYNARVVPSKDYGFTAYGVKWMVLVKKEKSRRRK